MRVRFRLRRTTVITIALLAFLLGLGLARLSRIDGSWVLLAAILNVAVLRRRYLIVFTLTLFALSLGWWRGSLTMNRLDDYRSFYGRRVIIQATADNDAVYANNSQLTFDAADAHLLKPMVVDLIGKIKVSGFGANMIYRGDVVQIEGKLTPARGSRQANIGFAEISVLGSSAAVTDNMRRHFSAGMESALPEPIASFALGLLIGQRSTLPEAVNKRLAAVGLTHLVAVSGYNLTILVEASRRLLGRGSKYRSALLSLLLIGLFLLMTGLSASIVRAAIVSVLSIWAWYYGRKIQPLLLISLAAALTAAWNPLYLWSDIGWYLSFLAFFGVLVVAPLLAKRFSRRSEPRALTLLLFESLAAQLMTAPLIMYIFGQISLIGLVANLLLVPLVPLAMLVALLAGLGGMLWPAVAGWLAWPARILLTYMLDMVSLLSRVPHALLARSLRLSEMLILYGTVGFGVIILWRKTLKNAKISIRQKS